MIDLLAWAALLPAAIVTSILLAELAAAQLRHGGPATGALPRIAIIIPAHDEAAGIAAAVNGVRLAAVAGTRLLVVADNCSDDTAAIAAAAGAEVIERNDPGRRGKGFALAAARDLLRADPPEVAIVIDADCAVAGDGIALLAGAAMASRRPVQAAYLMRPRPERGAMVAISGFAFLVRNLVRQRGLARLGAAALLTGSGTAFPWALFEAAPLASDDLVEDIALGIALSERGHPPLFLEQATVWTIPARRDATIAQRTRWEQGFLRTAIANAPRLIGSRRWPLIALGLDLLVPPLALLIALDLAVLLLLCGLTMIGASPVPGMAMLALLLCLAAMIGLVWARFGRAHISAATLLMVPFYIIWKLPIYLAALLRPERRWIRTRRD